MTNNAYPPVTGHPQLDMATTDQSSSATQVVVTGEVDLATASELRDGLLAVLHDQHPAVLNVDLTEVTFLDCAGLGALIGVRNAATRATCQVWVTHPQPIVRRVLALTGLLGIFTAPGDSPAAVSRGDDGARYMQRDTSRLFNRACS